MGIIGFAFFVGILIWWAERKEIAATRQPSPCHACWCAGEMQITHWNGKRWVHNLTGGDWTTRLDALVGSGPHPALPRREADEISTPTFTPFEDGELYQLMSDDDDRLVNPSASLIVSGKAWKETHE